MSVPSHWQTVALSEIAEVRLGRQRSPRRAVGPRMRPYMRAANVTWRGIDVSSVNEMDFTEGEQRTYELRRGDILLAEASGSASEVGKPAIWRDEVPSACFQNTLIRVRCSDPEVVPFLYWHFMCDALNGRFAESSRGTGIHHLGAKQMENWATVLPPPIEQARIVAAIETHFSRLDAAVASLTRARANVKRARASVLKAAVEGRLVPTEAALARAEGRDYEPASVLLDRILAERKAAWASRKDAKAQRGKYQEPVKPETEGLPELPEGWCWASCDEAGEILLGRQRAPQYLTGRFSRPYLRVANIKDDRIDWSDLEEMDFDETHFEKYRLKVGDVLLSEGQSPELVGQSAIFTGGREDVCFQKTLHRFRPVLNGPTSSYAQIVFRAWVKNGVFMRLASITTNIAHLTLEKFRASPFPIPPLAEQHRIVAEVDRRLSVLDALDAMLDANLARCDRLRQAVLERAFEGRLVPAEAEAPLLAAEPEMPPFGQGAHS